MAVDTATVVSAGDFTPFRTGFRGGVDAADPVGTLFVDAEAVGDGSGGTVIIRVQVVQDVLGFPMIWVPTTIVISDNLAAAETVLVRLSRVGNARVSSDMFTVVTPVRAVSVNATIIPNLVLPIEPDQNSASDVLQATWATNTNVKVYHVHVLGPVFDRQLMAMGEKVHDLVAGIR